MPLSPPHRTRPRPWCPAGMCRNRTASAGSAGPARSRSGGTAASPAASLQTALPRQPPPPVGRRRWRLVPLCARGDRGRAWTFGSVTPLGDRQARADWRSDLNALRSCAAADRDWACGALVEVVTSGACWCRRLPFRRQRLRRRTAI
jgi:hypothetical protein